MRISEPSEVLISLTHKLRDDELAKGSIVLVLWPAGWLQ